MKSRVIYFDLIKILAIIMVVINHSYWYVSNVGEIGAFFNQFLLMFSKAAVPLFFMVSGALILKKKVSYKEIFCKRIFRMVIALILICILWTLYNKQSLISLIPYLFNGSSEDFIPYWSWYLYAMISLYLMTPFLQKMLKNFNNKDYFVFIGLFLFLPSFLKFVSAILPVLFGKSIVFSPEVLDIMFPIQIGYFVTGYYLSNLEIKSKYKNISIACLIISLAFSTIFSLYTGNKVEGGSTILDSYLLLNTVVNAISIFIILKYYFINGLKDEKITKCVINFSNTIFGIYLFHVFAIIFLRKCSWILDIFDINGFLGLLVMDFIVIVGIAIIIYFLRKIPFLRKIL